MACVVAIGLAFSGLPRFPVTICRRRRRRSVFFSAFNLLEAALPSLVSRLAPDHMRGAAMGAYATSQFIGAFVGGALGGILLGRLGPHGIFIGAAVMTLLWLPLVVSGARHISRQNDMASATA